MQGQPPLPEMALQKTFSNFLLKEEGPKNDIFIAHIYKPFHPILVM